MGHSTIFESIKGIVLDVDGTLYHQTPVRLRTVAALFVQNIGKPASMLHTLMTIRAFRKTLEQLRREASGFDICARQLEHTAEAVQLPLPKVEKIIQEWMFDYPLGYLRRFRREGLIEFLQTARRCGIVLGVYSDYPCKKKLEQLRVRNYFSSILSAWDPEVQSLKPNIRGFQASCDSLGIAPAEALYIGDRLDVDGVGAKNSGMRSVLIGGKKQGIAIRSGHYWTDSFSTLDNLLLNRQQLFEQ